MNAKELQVVRELSSCIAELRALHDLFDRVQKDMRIDSRTFYIRGQADAYKDAKDSIAKIGIKMHRHMVELESMQEEKFIATTGKPTVIDME